MSTSQAICASYIFHPVGQGLFASGSLHACSEDCWLGNPKFTWVYDCGTSSSQKFIDRELARLSRIKRGNQEIDLLTISHFDADHISGVARLLKKYRVQYLLLPYVPLWQRLLIGFDSGVTSTSAEFQFFLNPVAYLRSLDNENLGKVILIPGSTGDAPSFNADEPPIPPNAEWGLIFESERSGENSVNWPDWDEEEFANDGNNLIRLKRGSSLRIKGVWEFVPYNDVQLSPPPDQFDDFKQAVDGLKKELLEPVTATDRLQDILNELKELYDEEFGRSGKERNGISLFLYAGPIARTRTQAHLSTGSLLGYDRYWYCACCRNIRCNHTKKLQDGYRGVDEAEDDCFVVDCSRGILYTGDGYLDDNPKLDRLTQYLKIPNSRKILCLQVMHHGSEKNWHYGVVRKLDPYISAFSSEPNDRRYRHPDPIVWDAFRYRGRRQINSDCGLLIWARHE